MDRRANEMRIDLLLKDWEDFDVTMYYVGCSLGLMKFDENFEEFRRIKGVFWANNDVRESLVQLMERLVDSAILQKNDDGQLRWNPSFDADWLNPEIRDSINHTLSDD